MVIKAPLTQAGPAAGGDRGPQGEDGQVLARAYLVGLAAGAGQLVVAEEPRLVEAGGLQEVDV